MRTLAWCWAPSPLVSATARPWLQPAFSTSEISTTRIALARLPSWPSSCRLAARPHSSRERESLVNLIDPQFPAWDNFAPILLLQPRYRELYTAVKWGGMKEIRYWLPQHDLKRKEERLTRYFSSGHHSCTRLWIEVPGQPSPGLPLRASRRLQHARTAVPDGFADYSVVDGCSLFQERLGAPRAADMTLRGVD